MVKANIEYWQAELSKALNEEGIIDQQFYDFMKGRIKSLPLKVEEFGWGVFPITNKEGILVDIKMVVPTIYDVKSLCVNLHEYTHAYKTYSCLGKVHVLNIQESEQEACDAEKRYLNKKR